MLSLSYAKSYFSSFGRGEYAGQNDLCLYRIIYFIANRGMCVSETHLVSITLCVTCISLNVFTHHFKKNPTTNYRWGCP